MNPQITITISVTEYGFYPNADNGKGDFVCGTVQPTVDMALASIMGEIRSYAVPVVDSLIEPIDDDPRCTRCGIYRSEHAGLAHDCDGFTTQKDPGFVYTASDFEDMDQDEICELLGLPIRDYDDNEDEGEVDEVTKLLVALSA